MMASIETTQTLEEKSILTWHSWADQFLENQRLVKVWAVERFCIDRSGLYGANPRA